MLLIKRYPYCTFDLCVVVHQTNPLLPEFHMGSHCCSNWLEFWEKDVNILCSLLYEIPAALFLLPLLQSHSLLHVHVSYSDCLCCTVSGKN